MAQWHLYELQQALEGRGWRIIEKKPGNDYDISQSWIIERRREDSRHQIDFSGQDDMQTLPVEKSYACKIANLTGAELYFGRKGHKSSDSRKKWQHDLEDFLAKLE